MQTVHTRSIRRRGRVTGLAVALTATLALGLTTAAWGAPGDLDPTFGGAGQGRVGFDLGKLNAVAVQPNGGIVSGGFATSGGLAHAVVSRLNPDGTPDTQFGTVTLPDGGSSSAVAAVAQPDNKIVVVGTVAGVGSADFGVWRLTATGSPDTAFGGGDGFVEVGAAGMNDQASDVTVDGSGRLVVVGTSSDPADPTVSDVAVGRLTAAGTPDPAFNNGVMLVLAHPGRDSADAVAIQPADGKILIAGQYQGATGNAVLRLNPGDATTAPALDQGFGAGGVASEPGTLSTTDADLSVTAVGQILVLDRVFVASDTLFDATVARFTSAGNVDPTFASPLDARLSIPGDNTDAGAIALLPDGAIVVTGTYAGPSTTGSFVAKLSAAGVPDADMGPGGVEMIDGEDLTALAPLPDERIITAGDAPSENVVYRFVGDFTPAPSPAPPRCDGKRATIVGTKRADKLAGTSRPDVIVGLGGNDTITGRGKGDIICGGPGNDHLAGGPGPDHLLGGNGADTLIGGPGHDQLSGGAGRDIIRQ